MTTPDDAQRLQELRAMLVVWEAELDALLKAGHVDQARAMFRLLLVYREEVATLSGVPTGGLSGQSDSGRAAP